jgi:hypothetical protein
VVRGVRLGFTLVLNAILWAIWSFRNDIKFAGGSVSVKALVDREKLSSWKWFMVKALVAPVVFLS